MVLVTYYNANMQFPIFSENPLQPLQKISAPHNTIALENQNFLIHHNRFFTKLLHARTLPDQLAPKQITNLQTMTA